MNGCRHFLNISQQVCQNNWQTWLTKRQMNTVEKSHFSIHLTGFIRERTIMCQPYIRNIIQQMQQSAQRGQKQHWSAPFFIFLLHSVWWGSVSHFAGSDGKQYIVKCTQQPREIQLHDLKCPFPLLVNTVFILKRRGGGGWQVLLSGFGRRLRDESDFPLLLLCALWEVMSIQCVQAPQPYGSTMTGGCTQI